MTGPLFLHFVTKPFVQRGLCKSFLYRSATMAYVSPRPKARSAEWQGRTFSENEKIVDKGGFCQAFRNYRDG